MKKIGLAIDWEFHKNDGWVSSFAPNLVNAIIDKFAPQLITSQKDYRNHGKALDFIISMEPGWAAPKIKFSRFRSHQVVMMLSDPHSKVSWLEKYMKKNRIDAVLSQYNSPFFYHFPKFQEDRFIYFPWAVADNYIAESVAFTPEDNKVVAFGGGKGESYDVRNWCKEQSGISHSSNSGVENKVYSDEGYFKWLGSHSAIVAAGSSKPKFDLVTPKYFEICAVGALLIGQRCKDLAKLGFDETNSMIFEQDNFNELVKEYKNSPKDFLPVRQRGNLLVKQRHKISDRINLLTSLV